MKSLHTFSPFHFNLQLPADASRDDNEGEDSKEEEGPPSLDETFAPTRTKEDWINQV